MSRGLNKQLLIGNVGADPEIRTTPSGVKLARFSVAVSRQWNDRNGQKKEETEWFTCTAWDKLADVVEQYVFKGDRLYIEGRTHHSQSEDAQGVTRYWTEVQVTELNMLGSPNREGGNAPQQRQAAPQAAAPSRSRAAAPSRAPAPAAPSPFEEDDDLPF